MNERIKELYNQCFVELKNDTPNVGFDFEKFAELIVRECAEVGSKFSMAHPQDIRHQIKKHFGVEE